jgi:hypothetical protein
MPRLALWFALTMACTTPPPASGLVLEGRLAAPGPDGNVTFVSSRLRIDAQKITSIEPSPEATPGPITLTPGFVDAHAHPLGLGLGLTRVDLVGATTYAQTLERIGAASAADPWIQGRGWDQNRWSDLPAGGWPLASDLDRLFPERPVFLRRIDGHAAWVNHAALRAAGITRETPDPPGGRIVRGADGSPSGVLVDTAMDLVPVPPPSDSEIERALLAAQQAMVASGLVGVHDMGVDHATLAAWRRLDEDGRLKVHVAAFFTPDSAAAAALLREGPWVGRRLRGVGIKVYADGALGSRGALLSAPYADEPGTVGLRITGPAQVQELAIQCLRARAILAVHAIGDLAVTEVLDAFSAARAAVPEAAAVPLRIEHAQVVRPEDRSRFAALGVIASIQPTHATSDMPWAGARLGPERSPWGYAWRALKVQGARLALGSDFPVERHEPALGVWAAVTRQDLAHQPPGGWQVDQALTEAEVIHGFTQGTWDALGVPTPHPVEPGHPATLTVWNADLGGSGEPPRWTPLQTWIAGEQVWKLPAP